MQSLRARALRSIACGGASSRSWYPLALALASQLKPCTAWNVPLQPHLHAPCTCSSMASTSTSSSSGSSSSSSGSSLQTDSIGSIKRKAEASGNRLKEVLHVFDMPAAKARLASLEHDATAAGIWEDGSRGQELLSKLSRLRQDIEEVSRFLSLLEEADFAVELLEADSSAGDAEQGPIIGEAAACLRSLEAGLERWELRKLLSGSYDECGARLSITAGAGGVDAMDWAEMLERMYLRWGEKQGFSARVVERSPGEEAGLKSSELEIEGRYAYGYLKGDKGTHRLVRASPFNSKGLRQTSFAGVEVMPILAEEPTRGAALEIPEKDLEISFQRAGGKGGQNVNKVETGVRIVHLPTGLAVKCVQERTQQLNRGIAMSMLRAKLLVVLEEQQAQAVAEIRGDMVKAEWGQQIRNYVMHPYKLAKDVRTGVESSDVQGVLDGDLNAFLTAHMRLKGKALTEQQRAEE